MTFKFGTRSWNLLATVLLAGCVLFCFRAWASESSGHDAREPRAPVSIENPAGPSARFPKLSEFPGGGLLMSWVDFDVEVSVLRFAKFSNGRWSLSGEVVRGSDWFLNWADFASVVPIDERFWVAHWLVHRPGARPYDYDILLSVSLDEGRHWSVPTRPYRDSAAAEHGFVSIFHVGAEAGLVWLDGRRSASSTSATAGDSEVSRFELRFASVHRDGSVDSERVLDPDVCTCCQTAAAATPEGAIVAWRARTADDIRDHRTAVFANGEWSAPRALGAEGWRIRGCPTNGPALTARGLGIAAAWFSGAGLQPRVWAALSHDGGKHFGRPTEIDGAAPIGRVGVAWASPHAAVVCWIAAVGSDTDEARLMMRVLRDDEDSAATTVAAVSSGRDSGFPQIAGDESGLLLAWTGPSPKYGIRTAFASLDR